MEVRTVDGASAAALAHWLRERSCAVYQMGGNQLEVSPLGSLNANLAAPQVAALLQGWARLHPSEIVLLDGRR
jgi:hypothetical protein